MTYLDPWHRRLDHLDNQLHTERANLIADRAALLIATIDASTAALTTIHAGPRLPRVEQREASTIAVSDRTVTVIAVPYEEPAIVEYRGQVWTEIFDRSAFRGGADPGRRVPVNRDHDRTRIVGKVVQFDTADPRGLLVSIRIANTVLGDETLSLAADDMLSASVGFAVPKGGERLDRARRVRRILTARLDHIALVSAPAYDGARIVGVA